MATSKNSQNHKKPFIVAISQNKGGTAKTTTTINLGAALARLGKRVFVIDLDPQANLSSGLGANLQEIQQSMYQVFTDKNLGLEDIAFEAEGMRIAPAHISMVTLEMDLVNRHGREWLLKRKLDALEGLYDYVLIDCPPSLGLVVTNALAACDYVLVPIQTQAYALYGVPQLMEMVDVIREDLNPELKILGVLLTFTNRTRLSREVEEEVKKYFPEEVFQVSIKQNIKVAEAPLAGQSVLKYAPDAADDYVNLAREVEERVNR
jgi:chromosome partitioning protein